MFHVGFIALLLVCSVCVSHGADFHDPHCNGKQVIVHLFEWKWTDIANECERYLGPKGFCAVQVSPPMEHVIVTQGTMRPWWERYQPVSYKLVSRGGNENQFKDMVTRCKNAGVRIIVDAVVNHMAGLGRSGVGTAGSSFNSDAHDFPGVPYSAGNFHSRSDCPSSDGNVNNYADPKNVRNCNLVGLVDLDGSQDYVDQMVSGYFNHLISLGVAGFRVDAAKHMWPADIRAIQAKTHDLPEGGRPFFMHEVMDMNDGAVHDNEYFSLGYVTEFRYLHKVRDGASDFSKLEGVYDQGWGMSPSDNALIFVDNHDTQRGNDALTYKNGDEYKRAVAFTLANDYGFTRIMSSYYFTNNDEGPPHKGDYTASDVVIKSDGSCDNGWVCEHRWKAIGNMARFRNAVAGTQRQNFKVNNGVLTFNRGNKGFFAMSANSFSITVNTGLPAGQYCDLISDCAIKVTVDNNGNAHVSPHDPSEPFVAIITSGDQTVVTPPPNTGSTTKGHLPGYTKTVILIQKQTSPGENLFIRGGISRDGCSSTSTSSPCSIPIKHISDGTSSSFTQVNAWSVNDNYLDWVGAEPGQGTYQGAVASGTPAFWSTNVASDPAYSHFNKYGPHYWVVDVQMDCSKTASGFFEFKALVNGAWESDIPATRCTGSGAGTPPYASQNHFARCGYLNVFHFSSGSCEIDPIS